MQSATPRRSAVGRRGPAWRALVGVPLVAALGQGAVCLPPKGEIDRVSRAEYDLARDALERRDPRQALDHVARAVAADEANADAAYLGAVILLGFCAAEEASSDCRYAEAESYARKALAADPDHRDARNALGVVLVNEKRPADAIEVLKPLADDILYGSPEKAWGNLGWAQLEAGLPDEAIASLKRAVAAAPSYCVGHLHLGDAYRAKREHAAARQAYGRALEIQKGDCSRLQEAYLGRAESSIALGQPADAREDLQRCQDVGPQTAVGRTCAHKLQVLKQDQNGG